jgi:cellulose synthase/poly-beta-1,6-N-acetylglucosamine synthase-like glycosyltransferase
VSDTERTIRVDNHRGQTHQPWTSFHIPSRAAAAGRALVHRRRQSQADPRRFDLPQPPSDEERAWYLGRQHRWLMLLQAVSFALVSFSATKLALSTPSFVILLIPVLLYTVTMTVSIASSSRRRRVDIIDHEYRVADYHPDEFPTIDVFLPTAGEPLAVLNNTYRYVARMQWPVPIRVLVLDDGGREEVRVAAEGHGFRYLSRPNRGHLKKAGNLRFGYEQSDSDLIVIFDADFAPRSDFLANLVPYFEDERVGIVQSPQFFDARKTMHWLQRGAGATQELFYRWVQPSRDRSDAAICVGSCAVYRRRALVAAGGFAQIGHSEDVHTGVNMLRVGYIVRYVPVLVAKGLCPDQLGGFVNQQYRWCTGSMSLLRDETFHANRTIRWRQRLCFWAGFLYYITTAVNVLVTPVFLVLMFWLVPDWVYPRNSLYVCGGLVMWLIVNPLVMRGHWRISVLRVQMLYSYAHATAIWHIIRGRSQEWVATGAASTRSTPIAVSVTRLMRVHVIVMQIAIVIGLAAAIALEGFGRFWTVTLLAGLTAYVQLPAVFTPRAITEPSDPAPLAAWPSPTTARATDVWSDA